MCDTVQSTEISGPYVSTLEMTALAKFQLALNPRPNP